MGVSNAAIRLYQRHISPEYNSSRGSGCAFHPSCSEYTRRAVEREGLVRGGVDGYLRMLGCTPETHERHLHQVVQGLRNDPEGTRLELGPGPEPGRALATLQDFALHGDLSRPEGRGALHDGFAEHGVHLSKGADGFRLAVREARSVPAFGGSGVRSWLAAAAGVAGGAVAALVGAGVGLVAGGIGGAVAGWKAGTGSLESVFRGVSRSHGEISARNLERRLAPVTWVGTRAGACLGGLWGAMAGAVGGAVAGSHLAAFGAPLARNVTAEVLGA